MNLDAKGYIFCKYQNDHKISSAVMKNTYTPETWYSKPWYSKILDIVNKTQLPSNFTKYTASI